MHLTRPSYRGSRAFRASRLSPRIYHRSWLCSSCPNQYSGKGEKQNIETLAHPANIRRRRISADRSFHVLYPGKWMDRLSYHRCHSGTLHGFSHSTRRSQAIIKVFSSFFYLPGSLLKFYSVLFWEENSNRPFYVRYKNLPRFPLFPRSHYYHKEIL